MQQPPCESWRAFPGSYEYHVTCCTVSRDIYNQRALVSILSACSLVAWRGQEKVIIVIN